MVKVKNALSISLDIPGEGLVFSVDEEMDLESLTPAVAAAIQAGKLTVLSQSTELVLEAEEDEQTEFELPFPWPGPDHVSLALNGLVQEFGEDWTVDPETNVLEWISEDISLEIGDKLILVRR